LLEDFGSIIGECLPCAEQHSGETVLGRMLAEPSRASTHLGSRPQGNAEGTMSKSALPTPFQQLDARVKELQSAFDIQEQRIAQMQADDALPEARKRRRSLRALLEHQRSPNGNRNSRSQR
jgi:hypothetical protein